MCLLCLTRGQNGPSILTPELPILPEDELAFRHSEDTARIARMMGGQNSMIDFLVSTGKIPRRNYYPVVELAESGSPLSIMIRDWTQPYLA